MSDTIISVKNLTKQYQSEQAGGIKNISFDINSGDVVAIIGESGSGKSTLLKSIFGLLKTDEGDVFFEDKRVLGPDEQLIPGHKQMKMVTQDFSLNIYAKVYDNIASQLSNTDLKTKAEKTLAIMEHLRILPLQNKKIIELSGGEQQRVAIAKAMVADLNKAMQELAQAGESDSAAPVERILHYDELIAASEGNSKEL